ncbi:hypothetical protein MP228_012686 [Amoeboaphelidium protococcarum]|nr:hypothetical protein MP228_012686 [Amoeboaphelidium protococcarum]
MNKQPLQDIQNFVVSVNLQVHILAPAAVKDKIPVDEHSDYTQVVDPVTGQELLTEWNEKYVNFVGKHLNLLPYVKSFTWHYVTLSNYTKLVEMLSQKSQAMAHDNERLLVMSLVDGQDWDGWPGNSVLKALEDSSLIFTGASLQFYQMDDNKSYMKRQLFSHCPHLTPKFATIGDVDEKGNVDGLQQLQMPVLIKPSQSSGSRGISDKSVVYTHDEAEVEGKLIAEKYQGAYIEEFITGQEFTCFLIGSQSMGVKVYKPVQRVFAQSVDADKQFLSYEMKWNRWSSEPDVGQWWYATAPDDMSEQVQKVAKEAFLAVGGDGYCRLDLRVHSDSQQIYVVDMNANCSIDATEDSGLGIILKSQGVGLDTLLEDIFKQAILRFQKKVAQSNNQKDEQILKSAVNGKPVGT